MVEAAYAAVRAERQARDARDRAEQVLLRQTDSILVRFEATVNLLVQNYLTAAGFHKDQSNRWHKRRYSMRKKPTTPPVGYEPSDPPADQLSHDEAIDPLFQDSVVEPAKEGEAATIEQPVEVLNETPADFQQARNLGLLAAAAQIGLIAGGNVALCESLWRQVAEVKAKLVDANANPLETLLVDQIGICWLQAHAADLALAQRSDISLRQAKFLEKRRDQAHRRLTTAIKGLATIRKLLATGSQMKQAPSKKV